MSTIFRYAHLAILALALLACRDDAAPAQATRPVQADDGALPIALRFMLKDGMAWREITDRDHVTRLTRMADNEAAHLAMALYREAWQLAPRDDLDEPTLFIGLQPGGNFARDGFGLYEHGSDEITPMPDMPYLILDEKEETFRTTFLHEGAHVVHSLLVRARKKDDTARVAPIPHSTAAVTDRRTAFNEGWAIHLEAVNAHCGRDEETRARYDRRRPEFGKTERWHRAEYYAAAADLRSYAQNFARYWMVRDGLFAFEPAATRDYDYLRVQLDPARDRRALRSGAAMLASEGFVASVFFHIAMRLTEGCAPPPELGRRYRPLLEALRKAETEESALDVAPLADVVAVLGEAGVQVFLDLSRGATMDGQAGAMWARFYDAALAIDRKTEQSLVEEIEARRRAWERDAASRPSELLRAVGPVLVVRASGVEVGLAMFGRLRPMTFDLNAAGAPLLRLVPDLSEAQIQGILAARAEAPFDSFADFASRTEALRIPRDALGPPPQ